MEVDPLLLVIGGVLLVAVVTAMAPRLRIAGPLLLMLIGAGVSLLPFVDVEPIDPEFILVGVLPPLLYSAAVRLPAIEFRRDFRGIAGLSVVLVFLSSIALGLFFVWAIPDLGVYLALAVGAILSPTDAVATSIVRRMGISRRVTTLLEGESLLNDATSLVILRTMVAAFTAGVATTTVNTDASEGTGVLGAFLWGVLVAIVIGAAVGWLALRVRAWVKNTGASTAIGIIVPFAAYLPSEELKGSGLVAAVVAGIVAGQGAARWATPEQRMSDELNWRTIELVLEGAIFLIMGLELKDIVRQNIEDHEGLWHGARLALGALVIVLIVRAGYVAFLVWVQSHRARRKLARRRQLERIGDHIEQMDPNEIPRSPSGRTFPGDDPERRTRRIGSMRRRIQRMLADLDYYQASPLGWKHGTVIVWSGMRGVVTLAAAQTLPADTPQRPLIVFVAFLVAGISLLLQGSTLPVLVRMLRIDDAGADTLDRTEQTRLDDELRDAAASALRDEALVRRDGETFDAEFVAAAGRRFIEPPDEEESARMRDILELRLVLIEAMRARLIELSSGGVYSTVALRHALAELDADQLSLELRLDDQDD